jgi:PKHD-type hydroxylase
MLSCIPDILDWTEIKKIRAAIAEGEFEDGKKTAGYRAKRVKHNLQMDRSSEAAKAVKAIILTGLRRNPTFQRVALPKAIRPPLISRYQEGMNYGLHVDDAMMGGNPKERTDISVTVFLSDPADYDGGETVMNSSFGKQEIKLPAGAAVVYPSSTLHRVAPVTRGERLAAVTWVQSHVRDPAKREILSDLRSMRDKLVKLRPEEEEADLAFKTYSNLLRMWSE